MLLTALILAGSVAIAACGWGFRNHKRLERQEAELDQLRGKHRKERQQRHVYERALALPVHSDDARNQDLWARAAQGDELAEMILCESLSEFPYLVPRPDIEQGAE